MATARDSCASAEIDPKLIAPVQKRFTISLAGSTSVQRNRTSVGRFTELQQTAQGTTRFGVVIGVVGKAAIGVAVVLPRGHLQIRDADGFHV